MVETGVSIRKNYHLKKVDMDNLREKVKNYIKLSKSFNTTKAYQSDFADFRMWCEENNLIYLPASEDTLIMYISTLAESGMKMSTIQGRLSSISIAHQAKEYPSPTHSIKVRTVWRGIRNKHGIAQVGKAPITIKDLRQMIEFLPINIRGLRDRAMLLVGFAGAFRRSELVGLNLEDIAFVDDGLMGSPDHFG